MADGGLTTTNPVFEAATTASMAGSAPVNSTGPTETANANSSTSPSEGNQLMQKIADCHILKMYQERYAHCKTS